MILDKMGYIPFSKETAELLLFQLITDWYEQKMELYFSNTRLKATLVDRVIHHTHVLNFTGDSF